MSVFLLVLFRQSCKRICQSAGTGHTAPFTRDDDKIVRMIMMIDGNRAASAWLLLPVVARDCAGKQLFSSKKEEPAPQSIKQTDSEFFKSSP